MKQLTVIYAGWGQSWPLGTLADDGRTLLFEYSEQAVAEGLELSPINLPLSRRSFGGFSASQHRLPGLFADCLPDGWGMLLMDRAFRAANRPAPGPLDRLAFLADRAMGALSFVPADDIGVDAPSWDLSRLASENARVMAGEPSPVLKQLAVVGGSPQGARPKALVQFDPSHGTISTDPCANGQPWLVKFPSSGEDKEVCAIEQVYAELARDCGLDMPESRYFDLGRDGAAFGVRRFDRDGGMRVPIHSLAGLLDVDFRMPGAIGYAELLRATQLLTRDHREVLKAFGRTVFNVVFHNRDDHPKNFSWRMGVDRRWRLSPAYDLTYSDGPQGQHHLDVLGIGHDLTAEALLDLGSGADISTQDALSLIKCITAQVSTLRERFLHYPVRSVTTMEIITQVERCAAALPRD